MVLLSTCLSGGRAEAQTRISGGQTQILTNVQKGAAYTIQSSDCGKLVSFANSGPVAVAVPQAGTTIPAGCWIELQNSGTGAVTLTPAVSLIDGAASLQLATGAGLQLVSSGGQYYTQRGSSSSGTVNPSSAGQLGYYPGPGTAVAGAGCTVAGLGHSDLTCDSVTTNGAVPGEVDLYPAGSSTYVGVVAPASVPSTYTLQLPGAAPANQLLSFGAPANGVSTGTWVNAASGGGTSSSGSVYCSGSGTNAISCPGSPAPASYVTGMTVSLRAGGTNTGPVTLNVAGIGPVSVLLDGVTPNAGQIVSGYSYALYYDGSGFNIINPNIAGISPTVPGLQITFNTTAGTCSPSCTAAATGYGPLSNLPGITITDNYNLGAGLTRIINGADTSGGVAPYPEWGGASASASFRDILNNANSVLIPFTAAATGTVTDSLPGQGPTGPAGATGATGNSGTNGAVSQIQANGVAQTVQPYLNLKSGANAAVSCANNPGTTSTDCTISSTGGGGAPITTPGLGWFCAGLNCWGTTPVPAPAFSALRMRYQQFVLPQTYRYGQALGYVDIPDTTSTGSCGGAACGFMLAMYDSTCALISGSVAVTNTGLGSAGPKAIAFSTPANLSAGVYFLGYTSDSTTLVFYSMDNSILSTSLLNLDGAGKYRYFNGSNNATGHNTGLTPPSACGTMTALTGGNDPEAFYVEP
ncbi:MAG TPA: hypothetical protein VG273_19590 [Bryobacteraceae bacterium]|jgi:hypothetical protein|nr:hypothetical protein [Bryobacteraceae bacterium]